MMLSKLPSGKQSLIVLLVFIAISIWYYHEMIHWSAEGIHSIAQSDRLSLAFNYYEGSMNFFKPSTYTIDGNETGIAGAEFPLQSYLAAVTGKILGKAYITLSFRIITLLFSFIGFYTLFVWSFRLTQNLFVSFFPPVFYFVLPIGAYYAAGFLPDTCSLSLIIVSMYFLFLFADSRQFKHEVLFFCFGTLAVLIKMSAGVYFVAMLFQLVLIIGYSGDKQKFIRLLKFGLLSAGSIAILVSQYYYIQFLDRTYRSTVFLAAAKPLSVNYAIIKTSFLDAYQHNRPEYFLQLQEWLMKLSVFGFVLAIFKRSRLPWNYYLQFFLVWVAAVLGFIVMGTQFYVHAYYMIVIGYPASIFSVIFLSSILGRSRIPKIILSLTSIGLSASLLYFGHLKFSEMLSIRDNDFWEKHIADDITSANIGQNDHVLIDGNAPNLSLLFADRKGASTIISDHYDYPDFYLSLMRNMHLKYFLLSPTQFDSVVSHAPCFPDYMKEVWRSNDCRIFEYIGTIEDQIWQRDTDTEKSKIIYHTSFEDPSHCEPASENARTGNYSFELSSKNHFMPALAIGDKDICKTLPFTLDATWWIKSDTTAGSLFFVYGVMRNDSLIEYHQYNIATRLKNSKDWQMINVQDSFKTFTSGGNASFYLWNPNGDHYLVDDFTIELKKNK